jgi:hypothetical protein
MSQHNFEPLDAGFPDGMFSNQKSRIGYILEGLAIEGVGKLYGHLVYFVAIWYISWLFGMFFLFLYVVPRKIWQTCLPR